MASGRAAFRIRKYSWSNDSNAHGKGNYQHINADNIFIVLEGEQSARGRLILQIVQGSNVLDEIDLGKHIDIALSTRETFRRVNRQVADKQLPTYAVASGTKLAVTHRPEDGQIRRMQVALVTHTDCTKIVEHLQFRGMVFVAASRQHSNRPTTAESDLRSVNTVASALTNPQQQSFTHARGYEHSTSMQAPSSTSPHLYSPSFLAQRSAAAFLSRDEDAAPRVPRIDHPTASQIFGKVAQPAQVHEKYAGGTRSDPIMATESNSTSSSSLFANPTVTDIHKIDQTTMPSLFSNAVVAPTPSRSLWPAPRSVEDLLPPERELPFEMTRRDRSRSSSVLSLPPLPKPQLKKTSSVHSGSSKAEEKDLHKASTSSKLLVSNATTSHKTSSSAETMSLQEDIPSTGMLTRSKRKYLELESGAMPQPGEEMPLADTMPPPRLPPSSGNGRSSPKDMNELLYGKRPRLTEASTGKDNDKHTEQLRNTAVDATSTSSLTASLDRAVRSSESIGLEEYARLQPAERTKVLEKFILDMLSNKNFQTLCEDFSACWQRLDLGL